MAINLANLIRDANVRIETLGAPPSPVPTGGDDFYSAPVSLGQRRGVRAARTEARRTERQLRGSGVDVDQALADEQPGTWSTLTRPIFDILQIGQFVTAGAALEIQRHGLGWQAFTRAASEFTNALPGIEIDQDMEIAGVKIPKAERPSFSDVLDGAGAGPWSAAVGGFLLDVILDPITYTGFGLVGRLPRIGRTVLDVAEKVPAIKGVSEATGKLLVPGSAIRRFGREAGVEESADAFLEGRRLTEAAIEKEGAEIRDVVTELAGGMTSGERRLMGLYLDQPERFQGLLKRVAATDEDYTRLNTKFQAFKMYFDDLGKADVEAGLLDAASVRADYAPGLYEATGSSGDAIRSLFDKMGVDEARRHVESLQSLGPQIGSGVPGFAKAKKYATLEERILAGVPTELDIASMAASRGIASVRARNTRRFVDSVLNDPSIARRVTDVELGTLAAKDGGELAKDIAAGSEKALEAKRFLDVLGDQGYGIYRPFRKGEATWILPKPIIDDLKVADNVFRGKTEGRKFFEKAMTLQNMWKGYAVLSPGFHMRNMYSNWWNNFLGGVDNPNAYIKALRLQVGTTKKGVGDAIEITLKGGKKIKGQEIVELAKDQGIYGGLFIHDIPQRLEEEVTGKLWNASKNVRKNKTLAKTIREAGGEDLLKVDGRAFSRTELEALVAETAPGRSGNFVSRTVGQQSPQLRANRALGAAVENNSRLAHFIHKLEKGWSPEDAAQSVRKYLFDYQELTSFERDVLKTVIPFYTWARKNIPLQFQSILEHPGRYAAISAKPIQAVESVSQDWQDIPTPDYFQEIHAVRMPKGFAQFVANRNRELADYLSVGNEARIPEGETQPTYINPNLPFQDLNHFNWRDIVSGMSLVLKLPIEMMTGSQGRGFSFFMDREIERYPGEPAETDLLGTGVRPTKKTEYAVRTIFPTVGKVERLRERTGRGQAASQLSTEILGIKAIQVDIDRVNRQKTYKRRETLRALKQRARELGVIR